MEVAADVLNVNNMLLIAKGASLNARQIRLLKTWGVESVGIVSAGAAGQASEPEHIPDEFNKAAQAHVDERFSRIAAMTDLMRSVKSLAIQRVARRLYRQALEGRTEAKP